MIHPTLFNKDAESDHRSFYMRWSVFFNPKKGKFDSATKQKLRLIEVMGERKKGWIGMVRSRNGPYT